MDVVPGSMTCVTDLPLAHWSSGIDRDSMWNENSRSWPPTSDTSISMKRIGTWRRCRNSFSWPRIVS